MSSDEHEVEDPDRNNEFDEEIQHIEDDNEAPQAEEATEEKKVVKPKRIVLNPRPKLNDQTLKSKRGLGALPSYFQRVKFKGRGHEEQDLNVVLKTYEYWCHRLFPKYPFEDCIKRIETLGTKGPVQTHIKRIRLDLELDETEIIQPEDPQDNDQAIDNLFGDDLNYNDDPVTPVQSIIVTPQLTEEQLEMIRENRERAERIRREKQSSDSQLSQVETVVSDEQLEMIRKNRERAEKIRLERQNRRYTINSKGEFVLAGSKEDNLSSIVNSEAMDKSVDNLLDVVDAPEDEANIDDLLSQIDDINNPT